MSRPALSPSKILRGIQVPPWVPRDLADVYRHWAIEGDEFSAAKKMRAFKKKLRETEPIDKPREKLYG